MRNGDEPWTVLGLILWSADYLRSKGIESGRLDGEHLLSAALGTPRLQLYLEHDRPLRGDELDAFRPLLRRRALREPLQYVVGRAAFRDLDLEVGPAVLVPRPETEVLVDEALTWVSGRGAADLRALDLGTGSGAIAIALATEGAFSEVVGTDTSPDALEVARRNVRAAGLDGRVRFERGSLFEPVAAETAFDLIVSNPPYVCDGELPGLEPEVRDWEPHAALLAGPEGMDVLDPLVREAPGRLAPGGLLAVEVGLGQASRVAEAGARLGAYAEVSVRRDLTGRERFVLMSR